MEYINLVAHYKLNMQLHRQYQRFRDGLEQVVAAHWLRLFSQSELQVLISGAPVPINVADLQAHTSYKGRCVPCSLSPIIHWEGRAGWWVELSVWCGAAILYGLIVQTVYCG